jgi:hypothetical protein
MLSNLDKQLREPDVIDEALHTHREMWTRLYQASVGSKPPETPPS